MIPVPVTKTTKVFKSGNSQAVRLPKEFRFDVDEVEIFRRGDEAKRVARIDVNPTPRPSEVSGRAVVYLSLGGYTRAQNLTAGRTYEFGGPGDVGVLPGRYSLSHLCGVPLDPAREFVLGDGETLPACFYAGRENP